jgi:RimJ/RimL family protein N-acetyltransferase
VVLPYPPLQVEVTTPRLRLRGASDDLLEQLLPVVRAGVVEPDEVPFDDPMSLYEDSPTREWRWLRAAWRNRGRVEPDWWRLNFVVEVDGRLVGVQDVIAEDFPTFGSVTTFSWLAREARGAGVGREMRAAILHLAFDGFGAREATSEGFVDNAASNAVSRALGYQPNGLTWATRRGRLAELQRWRLDRPGWQARRRSDIRLSGVDECLPVLGLTAPDEHPAAAVSAAATPPARRS